MEDKVYNKITVNEELSSKVCRLIASRNPSFYNRRTALFLFHSRYDWIMEKYLARIDWAEIKLLWELLRRADKANTTQMDFTVLECKIQELTLLSVGECQLREGGHLPKADQRRYFKPGKIYEYEYRLVPDAGKLFQVFLSPDWYESFSPSEFTYGFEFYNA